MLKRLVTLALVVLAASLLAVGLALPAAAQQIPASFSGPVTAGQTITVTCPEGHVLEVAGGVPNAGADFYRNDKRKAAVATGVPPNSTTATSASWVVGKGARWAEATAYCLPATPTFQTITATGTFTGQAARVDCPASHPYLWSVPQVDAIDPAGGSPVALGYAVVYDTAGNPIGIETWPSLGGWGWQITLTCTDTWPQPPA